MMPHPFEKTKTGIQLHLYEIMGFVLGLHACVCVCVGGGSVVAIIMTARVYSCKYTTFCFQWDRLVLLFQFSVWAGSSEPLRITGSIN